VERAARKVRWIACAALALAACNAEVTVQQSSSTPAPTPTSTVSAGGSSPGSQNSGGSGSAGDALIYISGTQVTVSGGVAQASVTCTSGVCEGVAQVSQ
jgi:hypothetical protein